MRLRTHLTAAITGAFALAAASAAAIGNAAPVNPEYAMYSVGEGPCIVDMLVSAKAAGPGHAAVTIKPSMRGIGPCSTVVDIAWHERLKPTDDPDFRRRARGHTAVRVTAAPGSDNKPLVIDLPTGVGNKAVVFRATPTQPLGSNPEVFYVDVR